MNFRIILEKTPINVLFGLQKGKGTAYETVQKQLGDDGDLCFDCVAQIKKAKNGAIDFSGDCIHGIVGERFIYINIGTSAGQWDSVWTRRLKVPLRGITEEMISKASENEPFCLETKVPAIGKDGTPNCATVKPFSGWAVKTN